MIRYTRGLRVTESERGDDGIPKRRPLTARSVEGPEPRPTAWEDVRPALGIEPTTPSPNGAEACAPWAVGCGSAGRHRRTLCVKVFKSFNATFEHHTVVL